jgi:hypothetical protein
MSTIKSRPVDQNQQRVEDHREGSKGVCPVCNAGLSHDLVTPDEHGEWQIRSAGDR